MHFICKKVYRTLLLLLMLTSLMPKAVASTDPVITIPLKGSLGQVKITAETYARDNNYFNLSTANRSNVTNNKITNMVGVGIEEKKTTIIFPVIFR